MNANAACWFVNRHLREGRAEKTAFVQGDRRLGYGELAGRSDRMAGLLARHGLRPEERAALIALDTLDWPVIFWGCLKAGVVPVAVNTLLTTEQYRHILSDSRARALFVSAPLLGAVRPALDGLPHLREVFVLDAEAHGGGDRAGHDFAAELAASEPVPAVEAGADDCAFWLYSSGSTGQPKGVRHVHRVDAGERPRPTARACSASARTTWSFRRPSSSSPTGSATSMTFPMSVGATTVLLPGRPTPDAVFGVAARRCGRRSSSACRRSTPRMLARRRAARQPRQRPAARLRLGRRGAAGRDRPALEALTGTDILDGVGSTEMLHIFLSNRAGRRRLRHLRRAGAGLRGALRRRDGARGRRGEIGELLVRGATAADGYWNQRDEEPRDLRGRLDAHRRQVRARRRRLLRLLRAHRRHVQGLGHLGHRRSRSSRR